MATVLLVEDDPAARQGLELALRGLGYGVRAAGTGEAALRDVRDAAADVVVLDVMLPGLDGFEVCRRLRRGSDIAVITLATLAIGTGRVAPGPATTPKPLMSAAETPSAGHETAASRSWRGAAVPAPGVTVPGGDVTGPPGDAFSLAMARPARQASAASNSARMPQRRR